MAEFKDTKITGFQPKLVKDAETGEEFGVMVFKGELKPDNSLQISDLFGGFRKQLIQVRLVGYDEPNDVTIRDVHLDDFKVKTKNVIIGKGKEAERIPVEIVNFTMSVKVDETGELFKRIYSICFQTVSMVIE